MTAASLLLALVTLGRAGELWLAARNTAALRAAGGIEVAPGHYPVIVVLHVLWLAALWVLGSSQPVNAGWLAVFVALQAARVWVLATMGARWTTRIMVVPGEALVARGPYRLVDHPNYLVVIAEIAVLPLCLGLTGVALLFSVLNAGLLLIRVQAESDALRQAHRDVSA